jgi:hypothetical protein
MTAPRPTRWSMIGRGHLALAEAGDLDVLRDVLVRVRDAA